MTKLEKTISEKIIKSKEKDVVQKVLEHYQFDNPKKKLIELYFFRGKSITMTCLSVGISRATFYRWANEIIELTSKWVKELQNER